MHRPLRNFSADEQGEIVRELKSLMHGGPDDRLSAAIAKVESGIRDSKPILIRAHTLLDAFLHLCVFDDGCDLVGLRVREECTEGDGTTKTLEEDFPVFRDKWRYPGQCPCVQFEAPIQIRQPCESRDEEKWHTYIAAIPPDLAFTEYFRDRQPTMPVIPLARPVSGTVRVWISVYDENGHESTLELH